MNTIVHGANAKQKLVLIPFLFLTLMTFGQPSGYTLGTQVCWNFNGRDHGYFKAAGSGERHILIAFNGDGETNCSNFENIAPQSLLRDNGTNWDGRTVRGPNDSIVWEVFTVPHTSGNWIGAYSADIDYFFAHIASIDSSDHSKFHIMGLSGGVARMWQYLTNYQSTNSPYRNVFSTTISEGTTWQDSGMWPSLQAFSLGRRHWVWHGALDGGLTPPAAADSLYARLNGDKRLTMVSTGGHNNITWDSCVSRVGTDADHNRWLWMAGAGSTPPPPSCDLGGPTNYTRGTQVCWNFNGRDHGYFRAAGNGERHILISFTDDDATSCSNYQANSPQKLLDDNGINWDGRTVRGPNDTVVWEILTFTSAVGNWMSPYASDLEYFFNNICSIDTSDHTKFHVAGLGGGVERMWNFLINSQSHNSPYRNLFSTTINLSSPWLGSWPDIKSYSAGRKHWVWHGISEAYPTPTAAGQALYDSLQGYKRLTIQDPGGHNATTFDSCFSRAGTDTNSNRWLWMVTAGGSSGRIAGPNKNKQNTELTDGWSVYPNPASNSIFIKMQLQPMESYRLRIFDINGRLYRVISRIVQPTYSLDISSLPKGVYIIQVDTKQRQLQTRFMKE